MKDAKKIAIIDDDVIITKAAKYLLSEDYEIETFCNGDVFLDSLLKNDILKPDLILLDIMMPGSDGMAVLKTIKSNPDLKDIAVIIVSAISNPELEEKAKLDGANDFITKPYDFDVLKDKITKII